MLIKFIRISSEEYNWELNVVYVPYKQLTRFHPFYACLISRPKGQI